MALPIRRAPLAGPACAGLAVLLGDVLTKLWIARRLAGYPHYVEVWPNHLTLLYLEHTGGAWGVMRANDDIRRPFFVGVALVSIAITYLFVRNLRRYQVIAAYSMGIALGAGLGNVLDRIRFGYAVSFIDFRADWIAKLSSLLENAPLVGGPPTDHSPTFNVADIAVVVASILFVVGMGAFPSATPKTPRFWRVRSKRAATGFALGLLALPIATVVAFALAVLSGFARLFFFGGSLDPAARPLSHPSLFVAFVLASGIAISGATGLLAARIWHLARRLSQPSVAELRAIDSRPPVLFLRAFFRDREELSPRGSFWLWLPVARAFTSYAPVTFEDSLVDLFMWFGPPVALGHPKEAIAAAGAARAYVADDAWKQTVETLEAEAQLIVLVIDDTPAIRWELDLLWRSADKSRLFLVLPPAGARGREKRRSTGWYAAWESLREQFAFLPGVDDTVAAIRFSKAGDARPVHARSARAWHVVDAVERELEAMGR